MRTLVRRGSPVRASVAVPGDKSIAHRWLLLAATAEGVSELRGVPHALDVVSTARFCAALQPSSGAALLERWASNPAPDDEPERSTTNDPRPRPAAIRVEARGRRSLEAPEAPLDCGNSGTTMRLGAGLLASASFEAVLEGDESLSRRPMERVARPLREMGADVTTREGRPPVRISGRPLVGIDHEPEVPSAQVKSAVLLAGVDADGVTVVRERVGTRDHTERALRTLGGPVASDDGAVRVERFQHEGFSADIPGDVSSAAFLVAAAALSGGALEIRDLGLNPTRTRYLEVVARMGVRTRITVERDSLGEPIGTLEVVSVDALTGTTVTTSELPLVIDEVPVLAVVAASASGPSRFAGAGELRVKESDRLSAIVTLVRALGGEADVEGDDLVIGGGGLDGGGVDAGGDHRIAMAAAVAGTAAAGPVTIAGAEAADISFPGFFPTLARLGAEVDA